MSDRVAQQKQQEGALVEGLGTEVHDFDHEGFTMGSDDGQVDFSVSSLPLVHCFEPHWACERCEKPTGPTC